MSFYVFNLSLLTYRKWFYHNEPVFKNLRIVIVEKKNRLGQINII